MRPTMLYIDRMRLCAHWWIIPNQIKYLDLKVHEEHVNHFNEASPVLDSNTHTVNTLAFICLNGHKLSE